MPRLIAALPLLALAACNQQSTADSAAKTGEVSLTNAAPSEVARQAQAAGPAHFAPGEWETTVEIVGMDMPGMASMPPQMRDQMKKSLMAANRSVKTCVTPEQAAKPQADMLTGKTDGRCTYRNYTMANGRIDATLACSGPRGGEMTQTIAGTFTDASFTLASEVHSSGGPGGSMNMKARTTGKRIGDCKGS
ncbi:DUF3617 domain-containing protein [Sphingomonas sp. dw_22]|uniref:DUF3617 domain-containing protein n=1 Tax=Sphingomonas sp. dw_22 TaxID=2721175 RepID=UPI001BD41E79|nr:DUF3617 domain-containing protein [Sphingomonas sp. dw_22]